MKKFLLTSLFLLTVFAKLSFACQPDLSGYHYNPSNAGNTLELYEACNHGYSGTEPTPIIIFARGGCTDSGLAAIGLTIEPWKTYLANGFSVASIEYTDASIKTFLSVPSIIVDFGRAVQFFRYNASTYNVLPNQIIVHGDSCGSILWDPLVYGPNLASVGDPNPMLNVSTWPNANVHFRGVTYWPDMDQTFDLTLGSPGSGYLFGFAGNLSGVPNSTQKLYSVTEILTHAGYHIVPTLCIASGPDSVPPVSNPHDSYFSTKLTNVGNAIAPNNFINDTTGMSTTQAQTLGYIKILRGFLSRKFVTN